MNRTPIKQKHKEIHLLEDESSKKKALIEKYNQKFHNWQVIFEKDLKEQWKHNNKPDSMEEDTPKTYTENDNNDIKQ